MGEFGFDIFSIEKISSNFEDIERFYNFLNRLEQVELKKVSKAILSNYTNRNWDSLSKDCSYLKELSAFVHFSTLSRLCDHLRSHLDISNLNSKLINKFIYEVLLHLEHLSSSIKDHFEQNSGFRHEYRKEDCELFSYSSIRFKDMKIIKTVPPSMKTNSPLDP